MSILSNEKINFKYIEKNTFKEMMKLGRMIIQDELILKLSKKIKGLEEEKIKLYEDGKIEGTKESEYVFCEHDGIYIKKQKSKKYHGKKVYKVKH